MKAIVKVYYEAETKITIDAPEKYIKRLNCTLDTSKMDDDETDELYDEAEEYLKKAIEQKHPGWTVNDLDVQ